ncbi:sensor histidine kinase [Fervidibacillus halotolerans]|uniref:Signal transduction histidine-protein kinase/phosphatase DegS n=1 Tax=Fervidibacillus halotolerans TaxID=2980027 RepID=A0A9E8LYQ4_9BACI|nr:sensor histidine kinase [Fervidibacillus halotolerans]WAA12034.1 sensor histidine kinase [Fervidibacillus halotolerans]
MPIKQIDPKILDEIVEKMIDTVGKSKDEIFQIGESCRNDVGQIYEELKQIKELVNRVIDEEEKLDREVRSARKRLSEVSMHFNNYSEEEVRDAYEYAHRMQMKLTMTRQLEKQLRERRDELERRLVGLKEIIERSDRLVSQVTVVLNYLNGDMKNVSEYIQDAKEKQEFGLKIIEAQEEERKRLSREIHDGPAQMLANVIMRSDLIEKISRERGMDEALLEIKNLKKTVRDALYEVRHIIYDLRPMALDDLGLVPTLKKYLQTVEEYSGTAKITFSNIGLEKRLDSQMEVALFRLIQESVQNAIKHAKANVIQVKLEIMEKQIVAVIRDDGIGFNPEETKEGSFGMRGMKERVELLDGELKIDSKIGKGTRVMIRIPLNKDD